jgi:hypothetical protein
MEQVMEQMYRRKITLFSRGGNGASRSVAPSEYFRVSVVAIFQNLRAKFNFPENSDII